MRPVRDEHAIHGREKARKLASERAILPSGRRKRAQFLPDQIIECALGAEAALDRACRPALLDPDLLEIAWRWNVLRTAAASNPTRTTQEVRATIEACDGLSAGGPIRLPSIAPRRTCAAGSR
jgi:hypothetical protein